jgi:hypothetical protein
MQRWISIRIIDGNEASVGCYAGFCTEGAQQRNQEKLRRTRIDVEVRQVKHLDALPTRLLWRRQWIGLWLGKPPGEVQRGRRRKRTRLRDEVLAYHLKQREYREHRSNVGYTVPVQRHSTHLAIIPRNVRVSQHLGNHRAQRRRAVCDVASAGELELLT